MGEAWSSQRAHIAARQVVSAGWFPAGNAVRLLADAAVDALAQKVRVPAVPRVIHDLRHEHVAKLQVRTVGAEVGDAGVPGAEVGDAGYELVGELHLGPPLPPGVVHDRRVGDRTVPVAVPVLVGAVQFRRVLAGRHPASPLPLGQAPHQPEQRHRRRRYRAPGKLLGIQAISISGHERIGANLWFAEAIATLGLVLVIFGSLRSGRTDTIVYAVGGYITAAHWFTSFANPAVTIARMFSDTFAGIQPGSVAMFILMQLIGGAIALAAVRLLYPGVHLPADTVDAPADTTR